MLIMLVACWKYVT